MSETKQFGPELITDDTEAALPAEVSALITARLSELNKLIDGAVMDVSVQPERDLLNVRPQN